VLGTTFFYIEGRWTEPEVRCLSIDVLEAHTLDMLTGTMLDLADRRHKSGAQIAQCQSPTTRPRSTAQGVANPRSGACTR